MNRIENPQFPETELWKQKLKPGDNVLYMGRTYEIESVTRTKVGLLLNIKVPVTISAHAVESKVFKININNDM